MCCAPSSSLVALAFAMLLASCGSLDMTVPEPFLRLSTGGGEIKATTPDDARLWVREFDDPEHGDVAFWTKALHHDLDARGYRALEDQASARDAAGNEGQVRSYVAILDGVEHGYLVAVFVPSAGTVRVAEFVAPRARFDELAPIVRAALATLGR